MIKIFYSINQFLTNLDKRKKTKKKQNGVQKWTLSFSEPFDHSPYSQQGSMCGSIYGGLQVYFWKQCDVSDWKPLTTRKKSCWLPKGRNTRLWRGHNSPTMWPPMATWVFRWHHCSLANSCSLWQPDGGCGSWSHHGPATCLVCIPPWAQNRVGSLRVGIPGTDVARAWFSRHVATNGCMSLPVMSMFLWETRAAIGCAIDSYPNKFIHYLLNAVVLMRWVAGLIKYLHAIFKNAHKAIEISVSTI